MRKELIAPLTFLVFFLCVVVFIMSSALSMTDNMDDGGGMFKIMFFGVGAFMAIMAIFAMISLIRKRPAASATGSERLIDKNHTGPQADYCPVCHANMGRYDKCPECGFRKEWR